jgi:hypothetical protein
MNLLPVLQVQVLHLWKPQAVQIEWQRLIVPALRRYVTIGLLPMLPVALEALGTSTVSYYDSLGPLSSNTIGWPVDPSEMTISTGAEAERPFCYSAGGSQAAWLQMNIKQPRSHIHLLVQKTCLYPITHSQHQTRG